MQVARLNLARPLYEPITAVDAYPDGTNAGRIRTPVARSIAHMGSASLAGDESESYH